MTSGVYASRETSAGNPTWINTNKLTAGATIVNAFVGKDDRNLDDELAAVVATNVNPAGAAFIGNPTSDTTTARLSISLVEMELADNGAITHVVDSTGTSDFKLIRQALGNGGLLDGDADFDGGVSINDFNALAADFGVVDRLCRVAQRPAALEAVTGVPEPSAVAGIVVGATAALRRRRASTH